MWVLILNDMRSSNIENVMPRFRAETLEALENFLEKEKVEPYIDGPWSKSYRKGGPLEWYNVPTGAVGPDFMDAGTTEDWAQIAKQRYIDQVMSLPLV